MLWSVVICDLLFKLEDLKSRNDDAAIKISAAIEAKQKAAPRSPEWEELLVSRVKETTHLLDESERINLETLQKHRHLSAHPVLLTATYGLFSPNRETARAHMRNALEAVLIQPALMSGKIFDAFLDDVERLSTVVPHESPEDSELRRYLDERYFSRLAPAVADRVFRQLWRVVFKSEDPRCEANRAINFRALRILFGRHAARTLEAIGGEPDWFSEVALNGSPLKMLVTFLAQNPRVYPVLTDAPKVLLGKHVEGDSDQFALAWFLSPSLRRHVEILATKVVEVRNFTIKGETFDRLIARAKDEGELPAMRDLGIAFYTRSSSYDQADERFKHMLAPQLDHLTGEQLRALLTGIEANSQTYSRGRAPSEHPAIKGACDRVLGADFAYAPLPNFMGSLPPAVAAVAGV